MKVLAIDHLAVQKDNRHLYHHLSRFEDLDLTLLIPAKWRENYSKVKIDANESNKHIKLMVGKNIFQGRPHMSLYCSTLIRCIREKPDIVYVNSEPENFLTIQVIILCKTFSPSTKIIFVTWRNITYSWSSFPYKLSALHYICEKITYKMADACRSFNSDGINEMKKAGFKKAIKLIPWGVDESFFCRRDSEDLRKKYRLNRLVIGFMGRFVKAKGIDTLIEALSSLKNIPISLMLLGNGPEKDNLKKQIEAHNMCSMSVIIDTVQYSEVPHYLSCLDILVLPSRTTTTWKEQFGRVLIESMACGTIVIGSDSGEIPNVIDGAGLVFKEGDAIDLIDKIQKIVSSSDIKEDLARKGLERVRGNFSWHVIANELYGLFRRLLEVDGK